VSAILLASNLSALPWLEHGFGTIASADWPPLPERAGLHQVHSALVQRAAGPGIPGEGDALVTNQTGLFVSVRTADCLPIFLADPVHRAVAAVHAGWRGTAANIAAATIARMAREFDTVPGDVWAAIGPCIQKCCYEVSADVAREFGSWAPALGGVTGKAHLDLVSINRIQLEHAGVLPDRTSALAQCTRCNAGDFHSFRRDGAQAGRMVSAIRIR
jgi:polyphenol oxidase